MSKASILTQRILPGGVILLLTLLLWLPFSFNVGPWADDWFFFANAERGISWGVALRPLLPLPHVLGALLTPDSFVGSNLVLAGLIAARSLAVYGILRRLHYASSTALLAAALTLALPIDSGVFYRGALTVYVSGLAYLLAVYCLLAALDQPRLRWYMGMWVALIVCVGSYEANYGLIAATPALLWLTRPRLDRRWRGLTLRWYLFPALWVIYYGITLLIQPTTAAYQTSLRASLAPSDLLNAIRFIYARHFIALWDDVLAAPFTLSYAAIAAGAGMLTLIGVLLLRRRSAVTAVPTHRRTLGPWALLAIGAAVIGLGVAVYLPSTLRTDTLRTYFVTTAGAALVLTAAASLLAQGLRWRGLPVLLTLTVLPAGVYGLLHQHDSYRTRSNEQQTYLVAFARLTGDLPSNVGIAIIDDTTPPLTSVFISRWHFPQPFIVLYNDPTVATVYCPAASFSLPAAERPCQFTATGLDAIITPQVNWQRDYERLLLVEYTASGFQLVDDITPYAGAFPAAERYNPRALIDPAAPLPDRACTLFTVNACP